MHRALDYIVRNKEWLFSGVGVVLLTALFWLVRIAFRRSVAYSKHKPKYSQEVVAPSDNAQVIGSPLNGNSTPAVPVTADVVKALIAYLQDDLEQEGVFRGQFGRGQRIAEEERYQTTKQSLDTKPRLYLTGWPVFVLLKHRHLVNTDTMLDVVRDGVTKLLRNEWIYISMGAHRFSDPLSKSHGKGVVSYRHTIRAVQILLALDERSEVPKRVLGRMLDRTADIQADSGGWRQCDVNFREEDLWGTSYAAGFLHACINESPTLALNTSTMDVTTKALKATLAWLHEKWNAELWAYDKVPPEENAPILFPELFSAAIRYRPKLASSVLRTFETYLDPANQPTALYLNNTAIVGPCAAATRLAYNFFLARTMQPENYHKACSLRDYALRHINGGYNCVEAAMLLDMLLTAN